MVPRQGDKCKTQNIMEFIALDDEMFNIVENVKFVSSTLRSVVPCRVDDISLICLTELFNIAATQVHELKAVDTSSMVISNLINYYFVGLCR